MLRLVVDFFFFFFFFFCKSTSPRASFCQQLLIFCMAFEPLKEEFSTFYRVVKQFTKCFDGPGLG
ncbi:hypothetical protein ACB092_04G004300 [Castanea dentata]